MNILITGSRSYVAYEWGKALSSGHTIIFADSLRFPFCRFAKFPSRYIRHASPAASDGAFQRDIESIVAAHNIDMIIPTCEEVFYLSAFKDSLDCQVFCDSHEMLLALHDKSRVFDKAMALGELPHIKLPRTHLVSGSVDIHLGFDSILKPVFSRFGAEVVMTVDQSLKDGWCDSRTWIQQEKIDGTAWCTYAIAVNGKMVAHTAYQSGARINQSASLYLVPQFSPVLEAFVRCFIETHGYHGQLAFDFIERAGDFYLIECNPRGTSGIHLLESSGIEQALLGSAPIKERLGDKQFGLAIMLYKWIKRIEFTHQYNPITVDVLGESQDFKPKCLSLLSLAELLVLSIRKRCTLAQASSLDLEWNG